MRTAGSVEIGPVRWWPLGALHLFIAVGAIAGGGVLVAWPDGSAMGMPVAMLQFSPFADFLMPGLLLLGVIGGGHLWAGILVVRRAPGARLASVAAGAALIVWIGVQVAMIRSAHWLHLLYFGLGVAVVVLAVRSRGSVRGAGR